MPWNPAKYCVSLLPASEEELRQFLPGCSDADIIEIRLDRVANYLDLSEIRGMLKKPIIVTVRLKSEGGFWVGSEKRRVDIFRQAITAGVDYIDVEWESAGNILPELMLPGNTGLILSHHSAGNDLRELKSILNKMLQNRADIYKLIYTAHNLNDNLISLQLIELARQKTGSYVIHAMGSEGRLSRIMGALRGNKFTYVSPDAESSTAEGQLTLDEARNILFLHEKSPETRLIGLLGYPIKQSFGWRLHNRMLQHKRKMVNKKHTPFTDFIYVNFPAASFEDFWSHWQKKVDGLSITIPHKEQIVSRLDYKGKTVELSGVCNTALKRQGKWYGFNTDMLAIYDLFYPWQDYLSDTVLVYGTGATARSALTALRELEAGSIYISGRNSVKGRELAKEFGANFIPEKEIDSVVAVVLMQTTPVGMYPAVSEMPPLIHHLEKAELVFDVIYNPVRTRLLESAHEKGCRIITGVDMYLRQAVKQFRIFSGLSLNLAELTDQWNELTAGIMDSGT